jgi:hypothetical protein
VLPHTMPARKYDCRVSITNYELRITNYDYDNDFCHLPFAICHFRRRSMEDIGGQERVTGSAKSTATRLIAQLTGDLRGYEDVETAIDVYKTVNWIIRRLEEVKDAALNLAEEDMRQRNLEKLDTPTGSAGWTEPQARQLSMDAWTEAMARDSRLLRIQTEFEGARMMLERAQESYKELPEPRFYIR